MLNREENYKYQKLGLAVLSKALDDICPTFENEPSEIRENLIKERVIFYKQQERDLDKEWRYMEREATSEVKEFERDRDKIIKKLEKTVKTKRIQIKVKDLEHKKQQRLEYLQQKKLHEERNLTERLTKLNPTSKKYIQISKKLKNFSESMEDKIRKSEIRYNTIINNTLNSDNTEKVTKRLEHSKKVWDKKYEKLKAKYEDRENIYHNKRFELDQIRMSINGFVEEVDRIRHWCLISGVSVKACYNSVKQRILMVGREVPPEIEYLSTHET